jgi:hypothetical protein
MKFRVTFKDPDGPYDDITEAATQQVKAIQGIDEEERESLIESKREKLASFARKWLDCGEYVTIEFDTDAGTAVVVPER